MADITLRETEGRPLTFAEVDGNFSNLNNDKQEMATRLGLVSSLDISSDKLTFMTHQMLLKEQFYQRA